MPETPKDIPPALTAEEWATECRQCVYDGDKFCNHTSVDYLASARETMRSLSNAIADQIDPDGSRRAAIDAPSTHGLFSRDDVRFLRMLGTGEPSLDTGTLEFSEWALSLATRLSSLLPADSP